MTSLDPPHAPPDLPAGGFAATWLDHGAVVVTDVERARRFYLDVLLLPEVARPPSFDFPGTWFRIGPAGSRQTIHLLGMPATEGVGRRHFCLMVDDVHAAARHIEACGCAVIWDRRYKIPGIDRFFTTDPDGNRIEIQGAEATTPPAAADHGAGPAESPR